MNSDTTRVLFLQEKDHNREAKEFQRIQKNPEHFPSKNTSLKV